MIFDIDRQNEGEWFAYFKSRVNEKGEIEYADPEPNAGRVCVRSITPKLEELQASRKRKFEFVFNPATRSMERVGYYEELPPEEVKKRSDDVWDYSITAWEGLLNAKGKPIECNRTNKLKFMAIPEFDRFIGRCLQMLGDAKTKAEAEKNENL
jgi:hypothetical protein